jgi:ubiquinone/menaquinone biosynthesis C-methylase UbiE
MDTQEVKKNYNQDVKNKFKGDYEYNRWFKNPILKAGYEMTKKSIEFHLLGDKAEFQNYLELGPGAGTWTKLFVSYCRGANFDLVDISGEMLKLAREALEGYNNIRFFECDFSRFAPDKRYDFFFSSRVIEYFPDKETLVKKIGKLLKSSGYGFIITKTPKYFRYKVLRRTVPNLHRGQINPRALRSIIEKTGCEIIGIYPVTMSFPVLKSVFLNKLLHKIFYKRKLNFISQFFSESYCVKFVKINRI